MSTQCIIERLDGTPVKDKNGRVIVFDSVDEAKTTAGQAKLEEFNVVEVVKVQFAKLKD